MEIYQRVLNTMPQMFSTNEYLEVLKKVTTSSDDVSGYRYMPFLKKTCRKVTNRTYVKNKVEQLTLEPVNQPVITEEMAVELLKSLGYKLLKPVKDWVEI